MNKTAIILLFLVSFNQLFAQNVTIDIKIDSCVYEHKLINKITFILENNNDFDCWIVADFLPYSFGIFDSDGNIVPRKNTKHFNLIGGDEYVKIEKKSTAIVEWDTDFFYQLIFDKLKTYHIETSYKYSKLTKEEKKRSRKSDFNLIQEQIDAKSNEFKICE